MTRSIPEMAISVRPACPLDPTVCHGQNRSLLARQSRPPVRPRILVHLARVRGTHLRRIVVEHGRDVFTGKGVGGVGYQEAGLQAARGLASDRQQAAPSGSPFRRHRLPRPRLLNRDHDQSRSEVQLCCSFSRTHI